MDLGGQIPPPDGNGFSIQVLSASAEAPSALSIPGLSASTTVHELKSRISDHIPSKPPISRQRIIYRGRLIISDSATLAEVFGAQEVNDGSPKTMHLALKPVPIDANPNQSAGAAQEHTTTDSGLSGTAESTEASGLPPVPQNGVLYRPLLPSIQPDPPVSTEFSGNIGYGVDSDIPVSSMFEARRSTSGESDNMSGGSITDLLQRLNEMGSDAPTRTQAIREYLTLKNGGHGEGSNMAVPETLRRLAQGSSPQRQSYLLKDPDGNTYGIVASPGGFAMPKILPPIPSSGHFDGPSTVSGDPPQRLPVGLHIVQNPPRRMTAPLLRPVVRRQFAVRIPANNAAFDLLRGVLGFIFSNIWLWLRISVLAYFLVRYERSYRSYFTFIACCVTLIAAQLGLLDMLVPVTRHIMQHLRDAIIFPQQAQPQHDSATATDLHEQTSTGSSSGNNSLSNSTDGPSPGTTEQARAQTPALPQTRSSTIMSSFRSFERMVLVFLCSIVPGVGFEEMIAERFELLRAEERQREEAAIRAEEETSGEDALVEDEPNTEAQADREAGDSVVDSHENAIEAST